MKISKSLRGLIGKRDRLKAESDAIYDEIAELEKRVIRLENLRDAINQDYSNCVSEIGLTMVIIKK